jgi:hypothetical protein
MAEQNAYRVADWNGQSGERWVAYQARLDAMVAVFGPRRWQARCRSRRQPALPASPIWPAPKPSSPPMRSGLTWRPSTLQRRRGSLNAICASFSPSRATRLRGTSGAIATRSARPPCRIRLKPTVPSATSPLPGGSTTCRISVACSATVRASPPAPSARPRCGGPATTCEVPQRRSAGALRLTIAPKAGAVTQLALDTIDNLRSA